ncbi:MAG: CRISPR-associated protein Cas6 [Chitinophagales bacterium]|nr:CRISPR-associated protein Cas6 [Chitinophagales bacterium]
MRVKITFLRDQKLSNSLPLHHQKILFQTIKKICEKKSQVIDSINFSSLKGTAKIQNGFMRFLSTKVTLVVSSENEELVNELCDCIFEEEYIVVGEMHLIPKSKEIISDPAFDTRMKYLCISPLILNTPAVEEDDSQEIIDPNSKQFSDVLYDRVLGHMEKAGYSDEELDKFAEFEAQPDPNYVEKIMQQGKKFARFYKNTKGQTLTGYLLPFTLHAHPAVHKFIWERGMGAFTNEGYGMVDVVKR